MDSSTSKARSTTRVRRPPGAAQRHGSAAERSAERRIRGRTPGAKCGRAQERRAGGQADDRRAHRVVRGVARRVEADDARYAAHASRVVGRRSAGRRGVDRGARGRSSRAALYVPAETMVAIRGAQAAAFGLAPPKVLAGRPRALRWPSQVVRGLAQVIDARDLVPPIATGATPSSPGARRRVRDARSVPAPWLAGAAAAAST